ncbi:MAG: sulfite exporter TauE/SafE family protein [Planctomycetota bacterium]
MILALLGALLIGLSLGLLGSGGSILTVPVLVYVIGQDEKSAIAGSLLVVGAIAAVGGAQAALRRQVDWSNVFWFGLPGMAGTWCGAMLGGAVSGSVQMLTFVAVMALAGAFMLQPESAPRQGCARAPLRIVVDGLAVGTLTGFVGVGGGFLIVPALVLLGGLPMQRAVGSSLVIIAMKSFSGFAKYQAVLRALDLHLDWHVLGVFVAVGAAGSLCGGAFGGRVDQRLLRKVFAWLLLAMALAIGIATVVQLASSPPAVAGDH